MRRLLRQTLPALSLGVAHWMVLARSLTTAVATVTTADIPQVVSDLDDLDSGCRAVQPCITALLARVALIDQTVIALPSSATVRLLHTQAIRFRRCSEAAKNMLGLRIGGKLVDMIRA